MINRLGPALGIISFAYALIAFVTMEPNVFAWYTELRCVFAVFAIIVLLYFARK